MSATARILIVDDNPEVLQFLTDAVQNYGYQTQGAKDSFTALALMEGNSFQVAIIDVMLPDINGIELMRKLKRIDPDIAPIIVTGRGDIEAAVEALNDGAEEYLLKPLNIQELQAILNKVVTRRRTIEQKRHLEEILQQSEERYRKSVSKIDDAIIITETTRHRIIDANAKAEVMTGMRIQDLLKMTMFDLFPEVVHSELREIMKKIKRCKQDMFSHLSFKRPDNSRLPVEAHAQWMSYSGGSFIQFICHDISTRKEIEEKKWSSQRFVTFNEIANLTKDKANSPLITILGQTEALKSHIDPRNTAVRESLKTIEEQVQKIQSLVDHLHDFSQVREGGNATPASSEKTKKNSRKPVFPINTRKHRILVVDDEPAMRQVLVDFFTLNRFDVVTSGDGEEGLRKFRQEKIDLVLTDLTMPKMDGVDLLKEIRKHSETIPVILMTGININQVDNIAKKYGADGYIVKPFSFFQVIKLVRETLSKGPILTVS